MSKSNGRVVHREPLVLSDENVVKFGRAIEERFLTICELWVRLRGEQLPIPKELDRHLYRWRCARVRHKSGDFRHTGSEYESMKTVAQWTLDVNCELRGQPKKTMEWAD